MSARPYYMRYPSDFISGIVGLTSDQICVYAVLLDLLYARRRKLDAAKPKDQQSLAHICSMTTRKFNQVIAELVAIPNKLTRDPEGRLSNPKFERWLDKFGDQAEPENHPQENKQETTTANLSPQKTRDNPIDNRADKSSPIEQKQGLNGNSPPPPSRARSTQNQYKKEDTTYSVDRGGYLKSKMRNWKSQNSSGGTDGKSLPQAERLARFQATLARAFGAGGWLIVTTACDAKHPQHAKCLALCKAQATKLGKGWPAKWPQKPP